MPADSPPINTALSVTEYSTNGSSYTAMDNVLNVEATGRVAKIIERRRKGQTTVEKFVARVDHGSVKITQEYGSAIYAVWDAFFQPATRVPVYIRDTMDDAGSTASKVVYYGWVSECSAPSTPGDDAVEEFTVTVAVTTATFTPGT